MRTSKAAENEALALACNDWYDADEHGPLTINWRRVERPRCNRTKGHGGDHEHADVATWRTLVRWPATGGP